MPGLPGHRDGRRQRRGGHAGHRRQLLENRLVHPGDRRVVFHLRLRNREPQRLHVAGSDEPRMDLGDGSERPDHQPRADQEHECQRDLRDDEDVASALALLAGAGGASAARSVGAARPACLIAGISPNSSPESNATTRRRRGAPSDRSGCPADAADFRVRGRRAAAPPHRPVRRRPRRRGRETASVMLSISSSRTIRPESAPSAALIASSCWRDSARTRSRLATLAQAMRRTMPIVPISTHKAFRTSPTRSSLSHRIWGVKRAFSNIARVAPGNGGNFRSAIGIRRATSALARSIVSPGFSRAIAR